MFYVVDVNKNQEISKHRTEEAAKEKIRLLYYRRNRDLTTSIRMRKFLYRPDYQIVMR